MYTYFLHGINFLIWLYSKKHMSDQFRFTDGDSFASPLMQYHVLSAQNSESFIGPMPPQEFLETFMPWNDEYDETRSRRRSRRKLKGPFTEFSDGNGSEDYHGFARLIILQNVERNADYCIVPFYLGHRYRIIKLENAEGSQYKLDVGKGVPSIG
jgi:hypothetical protein